MTNPKVKIGYAFIGLTTGLIIGAGLCKQRFIQPIDLATSVRYVPSVVCEPGGTVWVTGIEFNWLDAKRPAPTVVEIAKAFQHLCDPNLSLKEEHIQSLLIENPRKKEEQFFLAE